MGNGAGQGQEPRVLRAPGRGQRTAEQPFLVPIPVTDIPPDHYMSIKPAGNALGSLVPLGNEAKAVRKFCSFPSSLALFIQLLHMTGIENLTRVHVPIWLLAVMMSPSLLQDGANQPPPLLRRGSGILVSEPS